MGKDGKKGLGMGLGALFGEEYPAPQPEREETAPDLLPIEKIEPRADQPRKHFDPEALEMLAESIRTYGLIQPITVRPLDGGFYQIIAGERRWRASRMAGLKEVPVRILTADEQRAMEMALVENLQREDLNPIEEAKGYRALQDVYGMTQDDVAQSVGKSRPAVANATRLLALSEPVLKLVEDGTLSDVDEYVSCIEQSDQALRYFLNALSKLDRKVVVVFWGDHQPFFPSKFNDKWFTGEDDATHQERLWQTDYIIWANYDVAGCDQTSEVDDLSTNYLSTQLMQLIGAPLTDYQKAHMTLRKSLPAINSVGYEDASLRWALSSNVTGDDADAAAATKAREDYAKMQYYEMFRDGKNVYTEHFQTEANETDPNLAPGTTKIK